MVCVCVCVCVWPSVCSSSFLLFLYGISLFAWGTPPPLVCLSPSLLLSLSDCLLHPPSYLAHPPLSFGNKCRTQAPLVDLKAFVHHAHQLQFWCEGNFGITWCRAKPLKPVPL